MCSPASILTTVSPWPVNQVVGESGDQYTDRKHAFAYNLTTKEMIDLVLVGIPAPPRRLTAIPSLGKSQIANGLTHAFRYNLTTKEMIDLVLTRRHR